MSGRDLFAAVVVALVFGVIGAGFYFGVVVAVTWDWDWPVPHPDDNPKEAMGRALMRCGWVCFVLYFAWDAARRSLNNSDHLRGRRDAKD